MECGSGESQFPALTVPTDVCFRQVLGGQSKVYLVFLHYISCCFLDMDMEIWHLALNLFVSCDVEMIYKIEAVVDYRMPDHFKKGMDF